MGKLIRKKFGYNEKENTIMRKKTRFILALIMIVSVIMSMAVSASAATMPSCTGQKVSNRNASSFRFDFTIKNPSRVSVPQCGVQVRPKGGNWSTHTENIVAKHRTLASCPVWYEVGKGKEFNYTLNTNTAYEVRGFCKYGGKTYYSGIVGVPAWNVKKNPSCSGCKGTSVNNNGFKLEFTINNPSKVSVPECGARIRKKTGNSWTDWKYKSESIVSKHRTLASIPVWYQVGSGKEFNYGISANTTYQIQGYCKYNGQTFWSNTAEVRTPGPQPTGSSNNSSPSAKMNSFINDPKWKNGVAWGPRQKGHLSSWGTGCAAYCADFVKYCFNKNAPNTGSYYTSVSAIKAGDVLHVYNSSYGEHWIAVISRNGNSLRVAEGNVQKGKSYVTMVSTGTWVISGNNLYTNYAKVTYTTNHERIRYDNGTLSSPFGGWHYM